MNGNKLVYLDNNATTEINPKVLDTMQYWCKNAKNPSSDSKCAQASRDVIEQAKNALLNHCGCSNKTYTVIYTSGATESNCLLIRSIVHSYTRIRKVKPTLLVSAIEHESIMSCCNSLMQDELANIIYLEPNYQGAIPISVVEEGLQAPNIALICCMFANNEIGTINNLKEIGALAHKHHIPVMSDATQLFGKYKINIPGNNIDALSATFHKLGGPLGCGLLILRNELIDGYNLVGLINGTQQGGLRAGTENVPAIAASAVAIVEAFKHREEKNAKMLLLRTKIIEGLGKIYPIGEYAEYLRREMRAEVDEYKSEADPSSDDIIEVDVKNKALYVSPTNPIELIILGPPIDKPSRYLPNTILLAVAKNVQDRYGNFCNVKLKKDLDYYGVVCSIGSACNTNNNKRSHVLNAIRMPENLGRGVIRLSLGDNSTDEDVRIFLSAFKKALSKQIVDAKLTETTKKTNIHKSDKSSKHDKSGKSSKQDKSSKHDKSVKSMNKPRKKDN